MENPGHRDRRRDIGKRREGRRSWISGSIADTVWAVVPRFASCVLRRPFTTTHRNLGPPREFWATPVGLGGYNANVRTMRTIDRDFESRGTRCAGTLYLPDGLERPPAIVLAHGFGAERAWGLPAFAERFVQAGFAAFLFDYRGFGDSDGEPRRVVAPRKHRQDIRAAVEHVRHFDEIDAERLVLWGTSLGGGHALTIAAHDASFSALIAHVPHVDAVASLVALGEPAHALRLMAAGVRDIFHAATLREPYYIDNVGHPGDLAMLNTEDSYEGMLSLLSPGEPFDNRCAARIALTFSFYRPVVHAAKIRTPTLIVAAVQDSLIPIEAVRKTATRIADCKLVELDCPHFAPYTGEWFERSISAQLSFLRERLGG